MSAKEWKPKRLQVGTAITGERVICHERCIDALGRWHGLVKVVIEAEYRYPDLAAWSQALNNEQLLLHHYSRRVGERSFSGRLWLFYKPADD